jgi:hypothetical protein
MPDMLSAQATALAERGVDAREPAEQALRIARDTDDPLNLAFATWGAARARVEPGDSTAHSLLDEVARGAIHHNPEYARVLPGLARAAAAVGSLDLVGRLCADVPDTLPIQQHALATAVAIEAEQTGDHTRAAALYAGAARRWEQFTDVLEHAHALLAQGRCLTHTGDPGAHQPLRQARLLFDEMGARPRIDECDALTAQASRARSA